MKRYLATAALLLLCLGLWAGEFVAGIPVSRIRADAPQKSLNEAMRLFGQEGCGILHYDPQYAIALVPQGKSQYLPYRLTELSGALQLYLVGKVPGYAQPELGAGGRILLELESAWLLESPLDEIQLRERIAHPFTRLGPEPLRFPQSSLPPRASHNQRTDIDQMIALVNATSVQSTIQSLQDFQTRYARADNRLQVAQWIQQQFISYGVTDAVLQQFLWQNTTQYNVVATIPGTIYPNQFIVVGGHHDSISNNSDPYVFAPGADDNASGSVAALEMARVMMASGYQPRTSIRFVTFAAEEFGLWGSKHHAQTAYLAGDNIRLMMNHDMIANETGPQPWQVRLMPYDGSLDHSAYAAQITEQYTDLDAYYGSMNSGSSDSHPFWQNGYHVIYFFESDFSPVYHSAQDLVVNLNPAYCAEVIKASVACAASFADMPSAPVGLTAQDYGNGSTILLSWEDLNDPLISSYNVYYSTVFGGWGDPLSTSGNSVSVTGLTQGQLYHFAVGSVDSFGNESYLVYTTGVPLSVPLQPQNFSDQPQYQSIALDWDDNGEYDLAGYQLYRSQDPNQLGTQIGGLIGVSEYLDNDVEGSLQYYYYSLCAVDAGGNCSAFTQVLSSRPVSLDQGILIVDETENMSGTNPFQPSDQQADDFYALISSSFETTELDLYSLDDNLRLADLGVFSSILWHGNDQASMDYPYFVRSALQQYIQAGGNVFFSVYSPSLAFDLNSNYPAWFNSDSFIYDVIGIGETDYANSARFRFATPVHDQFPPVAVDPDKTSASLNGHILRVESIGPSPDCATIYNYGSDYAADTPQGVMNGMPVGVLNLNQSGKVCVVSFPLYNIYQNDARNLVDYVFSEYFNESFSSADDPGLVPGPGISLTPNHPNPFRGETSFRVELKNNAQPLRVEIYNLRGQLVKTLFAGNSPKSVVHRWDGLDEKGTPASSGIYILRASQAGISAQRRIALIK
ncbi:MAG: M20/M25/M40 family metallo-hydrolase [Candidatus Cloacimonetes bacterium]|nr:M20/M25/M40 family metallo-hydrolase [Candidatus Cloacimonadota bacterium]